MGGDTLEMREVTTMRDKNLFVVTLRKAPRWASCASLLLAAGCAESASTPEAVLIGSMSAALEVGEPVTFNPKTAAAVTGRHAGVSVLHGPLMSDATYAQIVANEFSDITPENATKWGELQPESSPLVWRFDQADDLVDFGVANGLRIKGHTLLWHQQLPSFITPSIGPLVLGTRIALHSAAAVSRYENEIFAWDVVNEAIADDGSGLRDSIFSQKLPNGWIDREFRRVNRQDGDAELYYNDYGIETINPKSDAVYDMLEEQLSRPLLPVPVDGLGFQGHIDARFAPSVEQLVANFERFAALGLKLTISELDVRIAELAGPRDHRLAIQKQIYQRVAMACVAVEACDGITVWGVSDAHSWIDFTFGVDDPLLLDDQYQRKPAYYGLVEGFVGALLDTSQSAPNLVGNSSLEAGLDGWSVQGAGTLATHTELAHSGRRSAVVSGRTANWNGPRYDISAFAAPDAVFDLTVRARVAGAASAQTNLSAQVTCAGEPSTFVQVASAPATDAGWTTLSGALILPPCAATVALYVEGPAAGVDIIVDDLEVRRRPAGNIIPNPGFESGTQGWFGWGPTQLAVTSDAHSGAQAVRGTGRTDSWNGIATNLTALVQAGRQYTGSAWVKLAGASSSDVFMTAQVVCAGENGGAPVTSFLRVAGATANDSSYVELAGGVTLPDCDITTMNLYVEGPPAGADILLDDVTFSPVPLPPPSDNLLQNGDFESGSSGWFGFGPAVVSATSARANSGTQSGLAANRLANWQGIATNLLGIIEPGASYDASAFVSVSSASDVVNLTLQLACDGQPASFTQVASGTANATGWLELTGSFSVPATCGAVTTATFYAEGPPAGVDIYLDDVTLSAQ